MIDTGIERLKNHLISGDKMERPEDQKKVGIAPQGGLAGDPRGREGTTNEN